MAYLGHSYVDAMKVSVKGEHISAAHLVKNLASFHEQGL